MQNYLKEFAGDFFAIRVDMDAKQLGIRIGNPILAYAFDKLPTHIIKDTSYNRQKLKFFKYEGIDPGSRQIRFYSRLRVQKYTKKPWPLSGTWCTYDNAWDVQSGLYLEVTNKHIDARVVVHETNSDWPSGLGGIFFSLFDATWGSLAWIFTGNFTTISDIIGAIGGLVFSVTEASNLSSYLTEVENLNKLGLIYICRTEYDEKGLWLWHAIDTSKADEAFQRIEDQLRSRGWL